MLVVVILSFIIAVLLLLTLRSTKVATLFTYAYLTCVTLSLTICCFTWLCVPLPLWQLSICKHESAAYIVDSYYYYLKPFLFIFVLFYHCNIALFIIVFALNNLPMRRYNFWRPRPPPHNRPTAPATSAAAASEFRKSPKNKANNHNESAINGRPQRQKFKQ